LKQRKVLEKVKSYVGGKPIIDKKVIKLNSNESPFMIPKKIIKKSLKCLKTLNRYHEPTGEFLREEIARKIELKPDNIILGNGSGEVIKMFIESFVEPSQNVIIPSVTFSLYSIYSTLNGNNIVYTRLDNELNIDLEDILSKATKNSVIFLANPNNPTGKSFDYKTIINFMEKLPKDANILLDEAYIEYSSHYNPKIYRELIKRFENLLIIKTFSKMGLAGLRIGYGFSREENIGEMNKVRPPFNTNILAQTIAYNLLKDNKFIDKIRSHVIKERERLSNAIRETNIKVYESDANFILIKTKEGIDKELEKKNILIRNAYSFGLSSDYYRITIGKKRENSILIKALREVLKWKKY